MKQIEITTAQKVTIQYELAGLKDRIFAYFVDMVILGTILGLLFFVIDNITLYNYELFIVLRNFILVPVFLFYTLFSEWLMNGRTLGNLGG